MQHLILASSSPRRKELLETLQLTFDISSSEADESYEPGTAPAQIVMELAVRKASDVAQRNPESFVIGADTIVVLAHQVLGKPKDKDDAIDMLTKLSGKTHSVYTGVAIVHGETWVQFYEKTDVTFWELTESEINVYIKSGEPFDKAGAYGIQGFGSMLVKQISGDYFAVVGLPVSRTVRELQKAGYKLPY
ncbi:septum formation inhibitor Maf [Bacillus sp. DNRA2]|uniref:Maf family protein n=1 Tax=Bacillus sp. DNRA2 TaxID=2723053 RepID=UPI00145D4A0A|nr:Maf family protein [Bacillus sp. DNRA2]NMD70546.1 septum formation inhibitor Maf [Bacillus sp. DNRA2]